MNKINIFQVEGRIVNKTNIFWVEGRIVNKTNIFQVEGRIVNKTNVPHYLCSKNSDWFTLWLSLEQMVPEVKYEMNIFMNAAPPFDKYVTE